MKRIVIPVFPGVQALDVTGPAEVFSIATRLGAYEYEIQMAAEGGRRIRTSSGLELVPHRPLSPIGGSYSMAAAPPRTGVPVPP